MIPHALQVVRVYASVDEVLEILRQVFREHTGKQLIVIWQYVDRISTGEPLVCMVIISHMTFGQRKDIGLLWLVSWGILLTTFLRHGFKTFCEGG